MKTIAKAILIGIFVFTYTGCSVKTNELTIKESLTLKNKSIVLSKHDELPNFAATTTGNAQFGLTGALTAIYYGNKLIENNHIKDPAISISDKLAQDLKKDHNIKIIKSTEVVDLDSDAQELANIYKDYDFVLDVTTIGWSSMYFASDWNNYQVNYSAHAKLIDVKSKEIVAEEVCQHYPFYEDTNNAPTYEELENGIGLRATLKKSIEYCVKHIQSMAKLHIDKEQIN